MEWYTGGENWVHSLLGQSNLKLAALAASLNSLRQSENLYRSLFFDSPLAAYVLQDGKIRLANRRFQQLTGYGKDELLGMDFSQLVAPEDREAARENAQKMLRAERAFPYQYRIVCKNGEKRRVMGVVAPIRYGGREAVLGHLIGGVQQASVQERPGQGAYEDCLPRPVASLAAALERRDPSTAAHQRRTARLASAIADEIGLSPRQVDAIRMAGLIHDIGKICLPTELLRKSAPLTDAEFAMLKTHPKAGYEILKSLRLPGAVDTTVLQHHERLDGSGYPQGIAGGDILLESRIIAVADVVDAMISARSYRPALSTEKALEEIAGGRGKLYDPEAADACINLFTQKRFTFGEEEETKPIKGRRQRALSPAFVWEPPLSSSCPRNVYHLGEKVRN